VKFKPLVGPSYEDSANIISVMPQFLTIYFCSAKVRMPLFTHCTFGIGVYPPAVFSPKCRRMLVGIEWAVLSGQWIASNSA
jgi:hypothetical protein